MYAVYVYRRICVLCVGNNKCMFYKLIGSFVCYMLVVTSVCCICL